MAINRGLNAVESAGGNLQIAAISSLRSTGNIDGRSGLIGEVFVRLDLDRTTRAGSLGISASRDDGTGTQVDRVAGQQFNGAVDIADGIRLNQSSLIHHFRMQGNASAIGNQVSGIIH